MNDYEKMQPGKEIYDGIKVPQELEQTVNDAIASVDKKEVLKQARNKKVIRIAQYTGTIAAAVLILVTAGLNASEVFAKTMADIPVIGSIAKVLTVRSYSTKEGNTQIDVEVPAIQVEETTGLQPDEETTEFVVDVNEEINQIVEDYTADATARIEEYKQAFLETGGTEEEWNDRDIQVDVSYEVKYEQEDRLSLVLTTTESWASVYGQNLYYNVDLKTLQNITLKDLLGEDYIQIANDSIVEQINQRLSDDASLTYWGYGEDTGDSFEGFTTITDDTKFYINEKGNPVVCFDKYEIGPGFMGTQEFEILIVK